MISSAIPSQKYSFSGSALTFANGSTATDGASSASGTSLDNAAVTPWSASRSSRAERYRAPGSFSRQRETTAWSSRGASGRRVASGAGARSRMATITSVFVAPANGGAPHTIS
jgi:hypothetical protein